MWKKELLVVFLFFIFITLQNSFLAHFSLPGAVLNLVFILFFTLVFFIPKGKEYQLTYLSAIAGILLDISSFTYLGPSIIMLLFVGFLLKKTQFSILRGGDGQRMGYFVPLFIFYFIIFDLLSMLYLRYLDLAHTIIVLDFRFLVGIIYNLIFAVIGFYIFRRLKNNAGKL